jgi:hypothetical protein
VDWLVKAKDSKKRGVSIFTFALKMEKARFSETLTSTNQSIRRFNLKEQSSELPPPRKS